MTVRYFRLLLIASLVVGVVGGGVDSAFPALLPEAFRQAQEAHDAALSTPRILFLAALGVVWLFMLLACFYGLYMLRPWAPRLSLVGTGLALLLTFAAGTCAQSGLAIAASFLAWYLRGAALVLALFSPFSSQFRRRDG